MTIWTPELEQELYSLLSQQGITNATLAAKLGVPKKDIQAKIGLIRAALKDGDIKGTGLTDKQIAFAREYALDSNRERACNAVGIAYEQGEAWLTWRHITIVIEEFRERGRVKPETRALEEYTAESLVRRVYAMLARCENVNDVDGFLKLAQLEYKRLGLASSAKPLEPQDGEPGTGFVFDQPKEPQYDPLQIGKRREMPASLAKSLDAVGLGTGEEALALGDK